MSRKLPPPPPKPVGLFTPEEAMNLFLDIKKRHQSGQLSRPDFEQQVKELMFMDTQKQIFYAIDPESTNWCRYEKGTWRSGRPPDPSHLLSKIAFKKT